MREDMNNVSTTSSTLNDKENSGDEDSVVVDENPSSVVREMHRKE
jgi:hypothetical protein